MAPWWGRPAPPLGVDVWTVAPTTEVPARSLAVLDAAERRRAGSLPGPASARFVLARALLRGVLGERLGLPPDRVVLRAVCPRCGGPHGQVVVGAAHDGGAGGGGDAGGGARAAGGLHVSVTRSGPLVAVALTAAGPVGVDVESRARVAAAPLADVVGPPGGASAHGRLPGRPPGVGVPTPVPARAGARDLAQTWVRTEAVLKALGTGLATDPSSVRLARAPRTLRGVHAVAAPVPAVPRGPEARSVPGRPGEPGAPGAPVAVADLRLGRGRVGAVALVRPDLLAPGGGRSARQVVRCYDGVPVLDALPR